MIAHAGLVAKRIGGVWRGVLIEGPSGSGKSDLALRSLGQGFSLAADDRVVLWVSGGRLFGRAPETLKGLVEARGLDILAEPSLAFCRVVLVAICVPTVERLPEPYAVNRLGLQIPAFSIVPFEASAPVKLGRALEHLGGCP